MNFNKAIVAGNLTRDPETRALPSGVAVASFSVASNRRFTDRDGNRQENTEFHNIVAFGKWADICSQYLKRGMPILVEGRLQTRSWQGQDGVKRSRTEIVTEFMQMGPRSANTANATPYSPSSHKDKQAVSNEEIPVIEAEEMVSQPQESASQTETKSTNSAPAQENITESEDKGQVEVDDIPF